MNAGPLNLVMLLAVLLVVFAAIANSELYYLSPQL